MMFDLRESLGPWGKTRKTGFRFQIVGGRVEGVGDDKAALYLDTESKLDVIQTIRSLQKI
jgi:hypothetical protein